MVPVEVEPAQERMDTGGGGCELFVHRGAHSDDRPTHVAALEDFGVVVHAVILHTDAHGIHRIV